MTPKKILLMAHDVTLAHLGRPLRLAEGLIADGHDVTLAASAESARFLKDFPGRVHTLAPTGKARFTAQFMGFDESTRCPVLL